MKPLISRCWQKYYFIVFSSIFMQWTFMCHFFFLARFLSDACRRVFWHRQQSKEICNFGVDVSRKSNITQAVPSDINFEYRRASTRKAKNSFARQPTDSTSSKHTKWIERQREARFRLLNEHWRCLFIGHLGRNSTISSTSFHCAQHHLLSSHSVHFRFGDFFLHYIRAHRSFGIFSIFSKLFLSFFLPWLKGTFVSINTFFSLVFAISFVYFFVCLASVPTMCICLEYDNSFYRRFSDLHICYTLWAWPAIRDRFVRANASTYSLFWLLLMPSTVKYNFLSV